MSTNQRSASRRSPILGWTILLLALVTAGCATKESQRTFATPDAAVEAMFQAISQNDTTALAALLGPGFRDIVNRVDPVQAALERQVLTAAMIERWWLEGEGGMRTVLVGNESYPMPIPLVEERGRWRFDTEAGKEELLYRRVGRNELVAMDVAEGFVDAQHEYATTSHDEVPKGTYAQHILSDEGKQNGLYWPVTEPGQPPSPMGALAARAANEGYAGAGRAAPYHGYYFKVLTGQGSQAPGGERSWIVQGRMTGGFGLLAWPAEYGSSGVMTFLVGPDGEIREKDLGPETPRAAAAITTFDPDSTWSALTSSG